MHITYDLPVSIDDILEAKQRLAGKIYKTGMPRSNYFSERCQGEPHSLLKAPRILNEPVRCIFSNLRNISPWQRSLK